MAAELVAFGDRLNAVVFLRIKLGFFLCETNFLIYLFTEIKTHFDVIFKGTRSSKERLMVDR